jgi:hypothetical protein
VRAANIPYYSGEAASIEALLRFQSGACGNLGSPLYEDLLRRAADDFEQGGPTAAVLAGHESDPRGSALPLRLMGAVHRLTLDGAAAELAERYRAGDGDGERTWLAFRTVLAEHADELRELIERPVQTNEVGRCAALLPGFLEVAAATGLPLRLLEVGASAGLNLRWDAYRYEAPGFAWGPPTSPLRIEFEVDAGEMPDPAPAVVAERRGCDPSPLDPADEDARLTLLSYLWPDQEVRLARMRAALELARELPAEVERGTAAGWIAARLAEASPGSATVVYHSVVMMYLPAAEREEFETAIGDAGARASEEQPLAWLRMEPAGERAEVRLKRWPSGEDRHLAYAGYHGNPVDLAASGR